MLALGVDKRTTIGAFASLTSKEGNATQHTTTATFGLSAPDVIIALTANTTTHKEEDGREEHCCPSTPGEAECVAADGSADTSVVELIAGLDKDDTVEN